MKKDQSFSTKYSWKQPENEFSPTPREGERPEPHLVIEKDGRKRRFYLSADLVAWAEERGGVVEYESLPQEYAAGLDALEKALRARCGDETRGSVWVSRSIPRAQVETPTTLGKEEHLARRALVERWLRERGLAFEVECATLHSDRVCTPLPPGMLDAETSRDAGLAPEETTLDGQSRNRLENGVDSSGSGVDP